MGMGGILSMLGKVGAGIAAPFTGGASLALLPAIDAVGSVLGSGASAASAGRRGDADLEARMAALNNNARLNAAQFNMDAPQQRAGQVARGEVLSTMQDSAPTGDARIDKFGGGGLRPSAFGDASRKAGGELSRQALLALMSKSDQVTPQMGSLPDSGVLEKVGGAAGMGSGILGALMQARQPVYTLPNPSPQAKGVPNLPYQPLPREEPWLQAGPLETGKNYRG